MTEKTEALRLADLLEMGSLWPDREEAARELRRLHHNNQVLTDALWKACGDNEATVNSTIASQGELK